MQKEPASASECKQECGDLGMAKNGRVGWSWSSRDGQSTSASGSAEKKAMEE